MKAKKLYIVLFCALLTSSAFASRFESQIQKSSQSWTQNSPSTTAGRGGAINDGESMKEFPESPGPVGDAAWTVILGAGLLYGVYAFSRKRKEV